MKQLLFLAAAVLSLAGCIASPPDHRHGGQDQGERDQGSEYSRKPSPDMRSGDGFGPDGQWDSRNCIPDRGC